MNGDQLVELIGRSSDDAGVLACLDSLARGQRPELDPDDPECCFDWIVLNEIGLEIGFDDAAWLLALDESLRRNGPILVSQVWFHVGGPMMQAFPSALPFGLEWSDSAGDARLKLAPYEASRSHYLCDAWSLPACHVSIAYGGESNGLRWIYCQQRERPWPEEGQHRLDLRPEEFVHLFGLRWSSVELREALVQLELEQRLDEVRKDGTVDLRRAHGLELSFLEARLLGAGGTAYPQSPVFAAVTFYAARELDSRQWSGALPFALSFADSQSQLGHKVGKLPDVHHDVELSGYAVWHFPTFSLHVIYSNVENRLLRVTLMAPGYWSQRT